MHGWYAAAHVVKAVGMEGKLRLADASAFLRSAAPGVSVAFVPPRADAPRFASVAAFEEGQQDACVATFAGVDGRDAAERLSGCKLLLQGAAPDDAASDAALAGIIGFVLEDVQLGEVGIVKMAYAGPDRMQPLLSVSAPDGSEALVPLADDLIVDVDEAGRRLVMQLPAGLLDI